MDIMQDPDGTLLLPDGLRPLELCESLEEIARLALWATHDGIIPSDDEVATAVSRIPIRSINAPFLNTLLL